MKNKYIIVVFLLGVICWIFASLLKIMHTPGANMLATTASVLMILAACIFAIKILLTKDRNSFFNK
jgi:hypothetical protein